MSKRTYPRLGMQSSGVLRRGQIAICEGCGATLQGSFTWIAVQYGWSRGDDEDLKSCSTCKSKPISFWAKKSEQRLKAESQAKPATEQPPQGTQNERDGTH